MSSKDPRIATCAAAAAAGVATPACDAFMYELCARLPRSAALRPDAGLCACLAGGPGALPSPECLLAGCAYGADASAGGGGYMNVEMRETLLRGSCPDVVSCTQVLELGGKQNVASGNTFSASCGNVDLGAVGSGSGAAGSAGGGGGAAGSAAAGGASSAAGDDAGDDAEDAAGDGAAPSWRWIAIAAIGLFAVIAVWAVIHDDSGRARGSGETPEGAIRTPLRV